MGEIKSTLEMVLERAARMEAAASGADFGAEEMVREGMRAGAAYMREEGFDLAAALDGCPAEARPHFIKGAAEALLRNIMLPRQQEQLQSSSQAMNGLVQVGRGNRDLLAIFGDLTKILGQYQTHRDQLKEQLEANFAPLMPQLEAAMAQKTGMAMKLKPSQHPKFQEEWQRAQDELSSQYGRAVEQHKQLVSQILAGMA